MRIWSIHPKYLDSKGLVALWRETLLAKNVLLGNTNGYKNHPQLVRFKASLDPIKSIDYYLQIVWKESQERQYNFDSSKFSFVTDIDPLSVTKGQLEYEYTHLSAKLKSRDLERFNLNKNLTNIEVHPLFYEIQGPVENWEKI